jgi:hypothetical protein
MYVSVGNAVLALAEKFSFFMAYVCSEILVKRICPFAEFGSIQINEQLHIYAKEDCKVHVR